MKIAKILVQGIVQGVGFRPTVYRIAKTLNLRGYVRNLGNIVEIILFENEEKTKKFISNLKEEAPPISKINSINLQWMEKCEHPYPKNIDFEILESSSNFSGVSVIPPDIAICDNCLKEIKTPNNRRYKYPFTACTDCGPRFTVIKDVPYDRDKTTMDDFPLCDDCMEEYTNPSNRRYHAEASCCDICGPKFDLFNSDHRQYNKNPIKKAIKLLNNGNILVMKGIGGTHLVAKVTDDRVIQNLRNRLNRPNQPFAVMAPDVDRIKTFAELSSKESKSLTSKERPIVVLKKNKNYNFAESLAPNLHNIGVMLPYSPLHHILFDYSNENAYIMTSANIPGEPMMIKNKEILTNLFGIADYYLLHNRRIHNRCDDSVIRYRNNELSFIRRSRGYTPEPYDLTNLIKSNKVDEDFNILTLGPELDVTFTLLKQGLAYVSQHIGNTNKFKTYQFLQEAIGNMMNITKTDSFNIIACDMHPQFFTTSLAHEMGEKFNCDVIPVQHHHAHGAVLAIDNSLDELIFIAADGVGYGEDGTAWGGEIMYTNIESYERLGSLMPQKMPGGDISTKYPVRMLASILMNENTNTSPYNDDELKKLLNEKYIKYFKHGELEIDSLFKQLKSNLNVTLTTSTGRILDSIAVALNICGKRTYEGECAMKLESFAYGSCGDLTIPQKIKKVDNRPVLDTSFILQNIMEKIANGENKKEIAAAGQIALSEGLAEIAIDCANKKGIDVIGATGGVFYNEAITLAVKNYIEKEGFKFVQHINSCPGDGSVSLGQAAIASSRLK
ncbi:MAG: carbamoyltransferase HypF [Methanobacteriaceae archaeon]|jgi:hydrogenase maturation protein HypF|nr:carbamoyltransferase HypF [Candidatus Methanorudis spinitermitis]